MTSTDSPITTSCTADSTSPSAESVGPWLIEYDTLVPPAMAWVLNSMIKVMPSDTITMVIGDAPRRWNGAYTPVLSSTEPSAPAAAAATRPTQMLRPAWLMT